MSISKSHSILNKLKIDIYADGASLKSIRKLNNFKFIKGFTSNPTLMAKEKIQNFKKFSIEAAKIIGNKSLSVEVFDDSIKGMEMQAQEINSWAPNIFIKIPITNTKGHYTYDLIKKLQNHKIKCNVTAIFTIEQIKPFKNIINDTPIIFSIFSGRIADAGYDPKPIIIKAKKFFKNKKNAKILWASPREIYNIIEANNIGCDIITVGYDILNKINNLGMNLDKFSIDTVKMFYNDAKKSKFKII